MRAPLSTTRWGPTIILKVADLTPRLVNRIHRDFPVGSAEEVARRLADLSANVFGLQDHERVMAAIVLASAGRWQRFVYFIQLVAEDWRDVLVDGDLAGEDWRDRLNAELPDPCADYGEAAPLLCW
jgi:hypothetical protein